jgi:hypothetical protein
LNIPRNTCTKEKTNTIQFGLRERQPRKGSTWLRGSSNFYRCLFGKPLNNQIWPYFADATNIYKMLWLALEIIRGVKHI